MTQLPLNALRVFEAAARNNSFRAAADELCVSQPAVSLQIKNLEDWLNAPLYDRTDNRPRLLPHGEVLARALTVSLADIEGSCRRARRHSESQTLVIAAIPSVAICWLIPRLSSFRALHPELNVRIIYAIHGQEIDFGDVDLAFVFDNSLPSRAGAHTHTFLPGISAPVCSPAVRETMSGERLPEGIALAGFLHEHDHTGWARWFARADCGSAPSLSGPVFEDFNLLRAAALAGQGVALCPLAIIREDLQSGNLVQLSDITVNKDYIYYLLEHAFCDETTRQATQAFRSWLFDTRDKEFAATSFGLASEAIDGTKNADRS
ncbi:LysR family transcriptional regulator [Granulosicoccus antarcticus]|uniref:Glycine cleavage system transcriptional activator n=1 Tax=Granulosicoccus antarcticus IMCC3135 TaxID=1192854 RepID=A0A2Z2NT44_9GAMM|nr:LysR family transcriptional regulator [Granulosicoccus antarcticus]ASJ74722.1 Glycine cleavage system transcriptional activator [Granulosicoccus antarcticus IMCC3135]